MYVNFVFAKVVPYVFTSTLALDLAKKSDKKIKDKMDAYLVEGKLTRGRMQSNEFKSHYKQIVEKSGQLSMMIDTQVIMSIKIDLANQCV